ncbi:MAG TPA: M67 family metallopeptidase [Bacteroidota bacterium]|nr:M67 family metallopeptidase [Bacteroidota bacterium]
MLRISHELVRRISLHGEQTYPEECCGALYGTEAEGVRTVLYVQEISNTQDVNRERRFSLTADQYRSAERKAKELHLTLLGFYHSHPDHPAEPSQFDLEHAFPWFSYIIQNISGGNAGLLTSWILDETRMRFNEQTVSEETT